MEIGFAKPVIRTCVTISPEFYDLCKKHHIKISEALRVGISVCLAEKGAMGYDSNLNIVRQKLFIAEKLVRYAEKFGQLEDAQSP